MRHTPVVRTAYEVSSSAPEQHVGLLTNAHTEEAERSRTVFEAFRVE